MEKAFRIMSLKNGKFCLETNLAIESLTDFTGVTSFMYCDKRTLDGLGHLINQHMIEADCKELEKMK